MSEPAITTDLHANHTAIAERIVGNIVQCTGVPALSPDGSQVAFTVQRIDLAENRTITQVWLGPTDGSVPPRPVTSGNNDGQPTFTRDGSGLLFTSRRSAKKGDTTLHLLPVDAPGELRTLATMPDGISSPSVSPDGRWVAFTSRTRDERYTVKGADEGDTSWQSPRKIETFFTRYDGEGWVFDRPSHVFVVPLDGTVAPRNLTPGQFQHSGAAWDADSAAVLTSAQRHDGWDLDFAQDIYRVGVDGTVTALTHQTGTYGAPCVGTGGVAFLGYDDAGTYPQNVHVAVIDGDAHRWVSRGLDRTFETTAGSRPPVWHGDALYVTGEDRGTTHLYRVPTDGSGPAAITSGAITVKSFDVAAGGTIVVTAGSVDGLTDLFVLRDGDLVRLTEFADRYRAVAQPLTWERFAVPCTDGTGEIDAWLMRPAGFDPTHTYPVLLNVHGGPHTQYGETFFDEAQVQAAAGFVVLMSNPRGGSGREQAWGQSIMGPGHPVAPGSGWGSVDTDDVLAVLDHALAAYPFCDAQRVGMLGGSYGGYMATWLAAHHGRRFKGICSERSVNNLITEEFTSDISTIFRIEHGPTHLDAPEEYMRMSPITYVRQIDVPLLIIHSEEDYRCPISQAEELFVALRLLGKPVDFYRFPGEGHELSRSGSPVHRRMRFEIILDWFADRLRPTSA
jgi:dipeptidyl aminopeptidase/acylaminoacyl peptidase